jgi:hypothetical protein
VKILLHSNAPWSASGYGQQAAMFAPRFARTHEVGISAFQGLSGSPFDFGSLRVYPAAAAAGATSSYARTPSATSARRRAGSS